MRNVILLQRNIGDFEIPCAAGCLDVDFAADIFTDEGFADWRRHRNLIPADIGFIRAKQLIFNFFAAINILQADITAENNLGGVQSFETDDIGHGQLVFQLLHPAVEKRLSFFGGRIFRIL